MSSEFVLVHGDYHGGWCWDALRASLGDRASVAVDLPSSGHDIARLGTRADDAAVLRDTVSSAGSPVIVVAHSASGIVTCEALAGNSNVAGVIFIAAVVLDQGQSVVDVVGHSDMSWADVHADEGYVRAVDPTATFYQDVEPETARSAVARLGYKSSADLLTPAAMSVTDWGWPTAYIVCEQDRAISPVDEAQMARRTGQVHSLPSSHSPFLSMPDTLAPLLLKIAGSMTSPR